MSSISQAKASHLVGTGVLLVVFGSGMFALLYIIQGEKYDFGEKETFDRNSAFWTATPVMVVGLLGILAGITKKSLWISLYIIGSAAATILSILVAIVIGLKVTSIRVACGEESECKNSDKAVLMGTIILLASILVTVSLWGGVKACQSKWGPSKNVSRLHVVGEFRRNNGSVPPPTVVTQPETQPQPSRDENNTTTSRQESAPSTSGLTGNNSMDKVDSHEYEEVREQVSTKKTDSSAQYENTNPRGDGTGNDDAGYENIPQGKENSTGTVPDDSPGVVEIPQDPTCNNVKPNENRAYEQDEWTTAF